MTVFRIAGGASRNVELVDKTPDLSLIIRRPELFRTLAEPGDLLVDINGHAECGIDPDQRCSLLRPAARILVRYHPAQTMPHGNDLRRLHPFDHGVDRAQKQVDVVRNVRLVAAAMAWEVDEQYSIMRCQHGSLVYP